MYGVIRTNTAARLAHVFAATGGASICRRQGMVASATVPPGFTICRACIDGLAKTDPNGADDLRRHNVALIARYPTAAAV